MGDVSLSAPETKGTLGQASSRSCVSAPVVLTYARLEISEFGLAGWGMAVLIERGCSANFTGIQQHTSVPL